MAAIFGYHPRCLHKWSGNQVFLKFHSKSLVPTPAIGDNQKWSPQADLLYVKPARCARLSPVRTENIERMFIFNFFFHNPYPILLNGKANKT